MKNSRITASWQSRRKMLHRLAVSEPDIGRRMHKIASELVGLPYVANALIGGPEEPEKLVVDLGGFDCVTFVESTLALARSRTGPGFLRELKQFRYRGGVVEWSHRLHYFSDWLARNARRGAVRNRTRGAGSRVIEARLGFLKEIPARRVRLQVVPKKNTGQARRRIATGSVVAFASTRSNLDYFHTGLLFPGAPEEKSPWDLTLVHASREAKEVIAEPFRDFLERNRMRGFSFAVPLDPGGA